MTDNKMNNKMNEPIGVDREELRQMANCCSAASEKLVELQEKLNRIIEIKKNSSGGSGSGANTLMFRQIQNILDTIANLEKINSILPPNITAVKGLCNQVQMLLGNQLSASVGIGVGSGGSSSQVNEIDRASDDTAVGKE